MKWVVDGKDYFNARAAADAIVSEASEEEYADELDEMYGDIDVCGYTYPASEVLDAVDSTAFRCGFSDWTSDKADDIEDELENMSGGDAEEWFGVEVEAVCEDEEAEEDDI